MLYSVPVDGGSVVTLASGQDYAFFGGQIAVDATSVYWTTFGPPGDAGGLSNGLVLSEPLGGGSITTLVSGQEQIAGLAVDGASLYWTAAGALDDAGVLPDGKVMSMPLGGGALTTLASGQGDIGSLVVNAASVFWIDGATGVLMSVPKGGGTPTTLTQPAAWENGPIGIAVDAANVYWAEIGTNANNYSDGAVLSVPVGGGLTTTLAAWQQSPWGIAIDQTSVYWPTYADNSSVMKLTPK